MERRAEHVAGAVLEADNDGKTLPWPLLDGRKRWRDELAASQQSAVGWRQIQAAEGRMRYIIQTALAYTAAVVVALLEAVLDLEVLGAKALTGWFGGTEDKDE